MTQPEVFIVVTIILLLLLTGIAIGAWIGTGLARMRRAALWSYLRLRRETLDRLEDQHAGALRIIIDVEARRNELDLLEQHFVADR